MTATITIIAAMAQNRCIGINNEMPWHISEDFKRFKTLTLGKPCIMGRRTFESIIKQLGKPLPGRDSIVLSRAEVSGENVNKLKANKSSASGLCFVKSMEEGLSIAGALPGGEKEIFVIGGAQVYGQAMPVADRLELTLVHKDVAGDAFFPDFNPEQWQETLREDHPGSIPFSFVTLERRRS